jgi:glutamine---fructose-6-phosphate transaminase (isomerizing)
MSIGTSAYVSQVVSQPRAVSRALAQTDAPRLDPDQRLVFTGVGSSLHACQVAAFWVTAVTAGRVRPAVVDALELTISGGVGWGEQLVVVSHRGTKRFTNDLLAKAHGAGVRTVMITGNGAADPAGDVVLRTCDDETASAHTVSYTTALAVLGRLVSTLEGPRRLELIEALEVAPAGMRDTLALPAPSETARRLRGIEPILVAGSGIDAPTASEVALKYKESTFSWAEAVGMELSLHGTPACYRSEMAGLIIRPAHDDGGRARELAQLLRALQAPVFEIAADGGDIPFADTPVLSRPLVSVVALQRLVGEVAELQGGDPDSTRAATEPWASAIAGIQL